MMRQQETNAAVECYRRAIALDPNCTQAYHNLGEALSQLQQWQEAITSYQFALKINPKQAISHQRLGDTFVKCNHPERAIAAYQASLKLKPDSFQLNHQVAQLLRQQGHLKQAIPYYFVAMKLQPFFQWSYWNLWEFLEQNQCLDDAVELYQIARLSYPNAPLVELNLGECLTQQGRLSEAIAAYRRSSYKKVQQKNPLLARQCWHEDGALPPKFIIVGTQKGGTTSLYSYLIEHPQILAAIKKEIHFWSHNYGYGLDWYLSHFPQLTNAEQPIFSGEASPNYFEDDRVAARIHQVFPEMKLILLLRNPVNRAISQYHHWVRLGLERQPLATVMESEMEQLSGYPHSVVRDIYWQTSSKYLWRGIYVVFLKHWLQFFPREQLLVLKSEDFYQNPAATLQQVFEFLELPSFSSGEYQPHNQGTYPSIPDSVRVQLVNYFRPHNQVLEEFLGQEFAWDKSAL